MAKDKVITWNRPKLDRFKDEYKKANASSVETFVFDGDLFIVSYAKYLIEYLEMKLPP
jgi:hypothetical protein